MSHQRETSCDGTDRSEPAETSLDPRRPIEVTKASGVDDNPGTNSPPETQLGEDCKDSAAKEE